jgi:hypothetical protein
MQIRDASRCVTRSVPQGVFPVPLEETLTLAQTASGYLFTAFQAFPPALLSYLKTIIFSTYKKDRSRIT